MPTEDPWGVFIGTRRKGARGTTPGLKHGHGRARTAVETWPCQGGARLPSCWVSSRLFPVSWIFWFVDLMSWADRLLPKVNGYLVGL